MRVPPAPWVRRTSAATAGLLVLLVGCEAVPTLTFESTGDDAAAADASSDAGGCPAAPPQNATCCGSKSTVPCLGPYCSQTNCTSSACDKCTVFCCSRSMTNVVCVADPTMCK